MGLCTPESCKVCECLQVLGYEDVCVTTSGSAHLNLAEHRVTWDYQTGGKHLRSLCGFQAFLPKIFDPSGSIFIKAMVPSYQRLYIRT